MATREATPTGQPTRHLDVYTGIDWGTTTFKFKGSKVPTKYPTGIYNLSLISSTGPDLLSSGVYPALRRAGHFPWQMYFCWGSLVDEAFLDLVKGKAKRECPRPTFKALTNEDFHEFLESIWDENLKINHSLGMAGTRFRLPVNFLGSQARRQPMAHPDSLNMTFTVDDINGVFDPIVDQIVNLVKSERSLHVFMAGGFGLNLYLHEKMKIMAKRSSPSTNIVCFEGDQGWTAVARGAVFHGIQANSQSNQPIVQVNSRASGEGYGLESSTDVSILWLVNPGDELSADGQNRRPVPPQAVWHGRYGRSYVNMYRQEGPNAIPGFASCLSWNVVGELQNLEFNFHWVGTRMHYILLYRGNQQVPLTIENYYDL
ncbi:hypothetical protein FOBRF1_011853 [Fusarium oxysporum]